jgi:hypothetical protein
VRYNEDVIHKTLKCGGRAADNDWPRSIGKAYIHLAQCRASLC